MRATYLQESFISRNSHDGQHHASIAEGEGVRRIERYGLIVTRYRLRKLPLILPDAYLDLGAMLRDPTDIVIHTDIDETKPSIERLLRGLFGHGYATGMRSSPLVQRLNRMKNELDHGDEKLERKLRYLFWLN